MSPASPVFAVRGSATSPEEKPTVTIEPYATLINKKILLPSQKTNYIAVETYFLVRALKAQVEQVYVDEEWYLTRHPDIQLAIKDGVVKNAKEHYALNGFYEHRQPYEILVDEAWYLSQYDDIKKAVLEGVFTSGQAHFEKLGYREGRLPYAGFQLKSA
jgi:hypothetical protein